MSRGRNRACDAGCGILCRVPMTHPELHRSDRVGWLRAAVLGADDGIVSTASLMIGVAASSAGRSATLVAGLAGLVAGAMSMAAGEYVSVSSQRDTERADVGREMRELAEGPVFELAELTETYIRRGLDADLAGTVARRLMETDPLGTHLREELGLAEGAMAQPAQAAVVSAVSFALGAALPLLVMTLVGSSGRVVATAILSLLFLAVLGAVGSRVGGAPIGRAAFRVTVGGGVAMAATAIIGRLVGATP